MNPTSIELPTVYYASTADYGGLRPKPTLENDRTWPLGELPRAEINAWITSAIRLEAELSPDGQQSPLPTTKRN